MVTGRIEQMIAQDTHKNAPSEIHMERLDEHLMIVYLLQVRLTVLLRAFFQIAIEVLYAVARYGNATGAHKLTHDTQSVQL